MSILEINEKRINKFIKFLEKKNVLDIRIPRAHRAFILIKPEKLRDAVKYIKEEMGIIHISTITAVDLEDKIEVIYHLTDKNLSIALKVQVPIDSPVVDSISDIIEGAPFYEREIHDLMGVVSKGHPNLKKLIIPEDWPEGLYPQRKANSLQDIRKTIDGREWSRNE
jgi:NADH:ubiquinone oxidoreductase subunit C